MSVVDYLKRAGKDSSYAYRKQLASQYGISNYTGTAAQNTQLLRNLQAGANNTVNTNTSNTHKTALGEAYSYENPNNNNKAQNSNAPLTIEARKQAVAQASQAKGQAFNSTATPGGLVKPHFSKSKMTTDYQKKLKLIENNKILIYKLNINLNY